MTADDTAPETGADVVEAAARTLARAMADVDGVDPAEFETDAFDDMTDDAQRDVRTFARALHDAGLLADPADRDANTRVAARNALEWRMVARKNEDRAERAEAEVARLTARLGDCHCDLNPATTDGPHEDCPQHGRRYAEWVEATDAKGAQVADLREWRRKILDVMGYDDTPEYAEELLTYLPVWKAEGEADRGHITELRATVNRVRDAVEALSDRTAGPNNEGLGRWSEGKKDAYLIAIEEAQAVLRAALDGAGDAPSPQVKGQR